MTTELLLNKCRGSLVGGAVGDALGYAVEFSSLNEIRKIYGHRGITDYKLNSSGIAEFSDDTQMSLFTAEGLLNAIADNKTSADEITTYITAAYKNWYLTQIRPKSQLERSFLSRFRAIWSQRAPGLTCMSALQTIMSDSGGKVVNKSKGCGGVMRVAPVGIYSAAHPDILDLENAGLLAGSAAEITHKHPLSTLSSMAFAMVVAECILSHSIDRDKFREIIVDRVFTRLNSRFNGDIHLNELKALIIKALDLAISGRADTDAILILGEGWVADETLAIAIFSVMRYIDDFEKCACCAVNHSGDSDSTGAVAGNIIGAILGYNAIPEKYRLNLELHDLILTVADALASPIIPSDLLE